MTTKPLLLKPGVEVQKTPTLAGEEAVGAATWVSSNLIRFDHNSGLLQKYGGWAQLTPAALVGTCRGMLSWDDFNSTNYLVMGTEQRLQVYSYGTLADITPIYATSNLTAPYTTTGASKTVTVTDAGNTTVTGDWINIVNPIYVNGISLQGFYQVVSAGNPYTITAAQFAIAPGSGGTAAQFVVTNGSANVTVNLTAHGFNQGDTYTVLISTTVANVTILGSYTITTVNSPDQFVFTQGTTANANTSGYENSGKSRIEYLTSNGLTSLTVVQVYGSGNYSQGPYGYGLQSGSEVRPRQWFFGKWGQSIVANFTNDGIYFWNVDGGLQHNPATIITQAPSPISAGIFVAAEQQQIIALAAGPSPGVADPMLVRWCDVADYTVWTATSSNQAGSFRLPRGSRIMGGLSGPQQNLIWTDTSLYAMQYVGLPYVWGFTPIGQGCGLISPRSAGVLGDMIAWMSQNNFYRYEGSRPEVIPCSVWDYVFTNINRIQYDKIFSAPNTYANEIAWFYPSATGSGEVDSYVKFQKDLGVWDYGVLGRTAWIDQSAFGPPMSVDMTGLVQQHETGNDANGTPMNCWAQTAWFKIDDGDLMLFLERMFPDFKMISGNPTIQLTVYTKDFPNTAKPRTYGPFLVTSKTELLVVRARGRLASLYIQSNDLGSMWRIGAPLYHVAPAGKI